MSYPAIPDRRFKIECPAGDGGIEVADYRSGMLGEFFAHHVRCFLKIIEGLETENEKLRQENKNLREYLDWCGMKADEILDSLKGINHD